MRIDKISSVINYNPAFINGSFIIRKGKETNRKLKVHPDQLKINPNQLRLIYLRSIKEFIYQELCISQSRADLNRRYKDMVEARQIAASICFKIKDIYEWKLREIGAEVGGIDHSSVSYCVNAVKNHCETENGYKIRYNILIEKMNSKFGLNIMKV